MSELSHDMKVRVMRGMAHLGHWLESVAQQELDKLLAHAPWTTVTQYPYGTDDDGDGLQPLPKDFAEQMTKDAPAPTVYRVQVDNPVSEACSLGRHVMCGYEKECQCFCHARGAANLDDAVRTLDVSTEDIKSWPTLRPSHWTADQAEHVHGLVHGGAPAPIHSLVTMQRHTEPSHSEQWGPLERFIAHCSCGWQSGQCYPMATAEHMHARHVLEREREQQHTSRGDWRAPDGTWNTWPDHLALARQEHDEQRLELERRRRLEQLLDDNEAELQGFEKKLQQGLEQQTGHGNVPWEVAPLKRCASAWCSLEQGHAGPHEYLYLEQPSTMPPEAPQAFVSASTPEDEWKCLYCGKHVDRHAHGKERWKRTAGIPGSTQAWCDNTCYAAWKARQ
jgi:hypothetical protein